MVREHHYQAVIRWTGNKGEGTKNYNAYERSHTITIDNKVPISASSDPSFMGDASKHNPEELLVAALSSCHMLWYLHLCAVNKITVIDYQDIASGTMKENAENGGQFTEVILKPRVIITEATHKDKANQLHAEANKMCFIANSVNFPVRHLPSCEVEKL